MKYPKTFVEDLIFKLGEASSFTMIKRGFFMIEEFWNNLAQVAYTKDVELLDIEENLEQKEIKLQNMLMETLREFVRQELLEGYKK